MHSSLFTLLSMVFVRRLKARVPCRLEEPPDAGETITIRLVLVPLPGNSATAAATAGGAAALSVPALSFNSGNWASRQVVTVGRTGAHMLIMDLGCDALKGTWAVRHCRGSNIGHGLLMCRVCPSHFLHTREVHLFDLYAARCCQEGACVQQSRLSTSHGGALTLRFEVLALGRRGAAAAGRAAALRRAHERQQRRKRGLC